MDSLGRFAAWVLVLGGIGSVSPLPACNVVYSITYPAVMPSEIQAAVAVRILPPDITPKPMVYPVSLPDQTIPAAFTIDGLIDLFGGTENLAIALAADRVELTPLQRVDDPGLQSTTYTEGKILVLNVDDAALLRRLITSDSSYYWPDDYDCMPNYAIRVKFHHRDKWVGVDLCFACRTLRIVRDGREIAEKNFALGYAAIKTLIERSLGPIDEIHATTTLASPTTAAAS